MGSLIAATVNHDEGRGKLEVVARTLASVDMLGEIEEVVLDIAACHQPVEMAVEMENDVIVAEKLGAIDYGTMDDLLRLLGEVY